jgi:O-antigen/teichoic acid export membrane protein
MAVDLKTLNLRKNVIFAMVSFLANAGLVFVSYRLIILQGGIETVGLWSTLFAWTSLIRIGDVGMASASLRFAALCDPVSDKVKLRGYIETGIIANAALFLLLTFVGYFILSSYLPQLVEPRMLEDARIVLPLMMAGFYLMNLSGVVGGSMQGLHLGYISSQMSVAGSLLQMVLVLFLVPHLGLAGMAWAQIAQYALTLAIGWFLVRRTAGLPLMIPVMFSRVAFREMLSFSLKAQLANIANGLFEPLSKIAVSHFAGLQALGIYELAYKTLWLPRTGIIGGVTAMMPSLTTLLKSDPAKVWPLYTKSARYATLAVTGTCIGLIAASPLISWLWLGQFNWEYTIFVTVLSFGMVGNAWGAAAYNLGAITGNLANNIAVNTLTLLFLGILILITGLVGANAAGLVFVIACGMGFGGVAIRVTNERLLKQR